MLDLSLARQHSFVEIDHKLFSTVIISLMLIQEGQLSILVKECAQVLVNCLEEYARQGKNVVR